MADMLASTSDLAAALQIPIGDLDTAAAVVLLEAATAVVQAVTGQRIVRVVDDEVEIEVDTGSSKLWLPQRPVVSVASVSIGATAVTDYTPSLPRGYLWRANGWRSALVSYGYGEPTSVTAVYTHGLLSTDQRIQLARGAVLGLAKPLYSTPTGARMIQIDGYTEMYQDMAGRMEASEFLVEALQRQYGKPLGSVRMVKA